MLQSYFVRGHQRSTRSGRLLMNYGQCIPGEKYGRLTVLYRHRQGIKTRWMCICECGKTKPVFNHFLKKGHTKSCGCLSREVLLKRCITHGKTHTVEFYLWKNIIQRCHNPKNRDYKNYGARGILMSDEWRNDFTTFLKDLGCRPDPKLTLERVDNDLGYFAGNVIWADRVQQANNRRPRYDGIPNGRLGRGK